MTCIQTSLSNEDELEDLLTPTHLSCVAVIMEHAATSPVDPEWFIYTSETKKADIPKTTLTHLRVDSSVTEIPEGSFHDCRALVQVQLPETLSRIGKYAFTSCFELRIFQFVAKASLQEASSSNSDLLEDGTIVFPEKANLQIDEAALQFCGSLRKVIVCSNSTRIGKRVFSYCQALISVVLPEGLQVIQQELFAYCFALKTVHIPSSVINICRGAFFACERLASIDLPHGLLEIGDSSLERCVSIETLHIPSTVSKIGRCAFFECASLSHIRVPPSAESILPNAFIGCRNLISVELPEGILIGKIEEEVEGPNKNPSLVNLAIPTLPEDDEVTSSLLYTNSGLGSVVEDDRDLLRKLKYRFDNSPLNKLCYYHSYHSEEDAMIQLRSLMEDDPLAATTEIDEFSMTPLHVLSLSQTPNLDMLLAVMKGGPLDHIILSRDAFGSTPMDYLCLNRMPNSTEMIRRVLLSRFEYWLGSEGLLTIRQAVDEALAVELDSRREEIGKLYFELSYYERKEILSLMELGLWKLKIDDVSSKEQSVNRQSCRINSGASIVISNVLPFLHKLQVEDYIVASQTPHLPLL
eukprot:scaffold2933_cov85-Cylindrotheca_fusiformis.AAC.3